MHSNLVRSLIDSEIREVDERTRDGLDMIIGWNTLGFALDTTGPDELVSRYNSKFLRRKQNHPFEKQNERKDNEAPVFWRLQVVR